MAMRVVILRKRLAMEAFKYCPEVYVGGRGYHIKTCHGFKHIKKDQEHKWISVTVNDILTPVEAFHLQTMFQPIVKHEQWFDFDRIPAVVELCSLAELRFLRKFYTTTTKCQITLKTIIDNWILMANSNLMGNWTRLVNRVWMHGRGLGLVSRSSCLCTLTRVCEQCSEVHIGPSGHKARVRGIFGHEGWRGAHWCKKAEVDDLIPPKVVWHRLWWSYACRLVLGCPTSTFV